MLAGWHLCVDETLDEAATDSEATGETSILLAPTILQVAQIIGRTLADTSQEVASRMAGSKTSASASMIVAGQRKGGDMRMFLIYPQGNFIEATSDTPYLQIGEHKYGKPILDRVVTPETSLQDAKKAVLLSMDSTIRSNLSVGMPLDMVVMKAGDLTLSEQRRIEADDEIFAEMSKSWSTALRDAFQGIRI